MKIRRVKANSHFSQFRERAWYKRLLYLSSTLVLTSCSLHRRTWRFVSGSYKNIFQNYSYILLHLPSLNCSITPSTRPYILQSTTWLRLAGTRRGVILWPLNCWKRGFEFGWGHGCLSLLLVVCCVGRGLWEGPITRPEKSYKEFVSHYVGIKCSNDDLQLQ